MRVYGVLKKNNTTSRNIQRIHLSVTSQFANTTRVAKDNIVRERIYVYIYYKKKYIYIYTDVKHIKPRKLVRDEHNIPLVFCTQSHKTVNYKLNKMIACNHGHTS